MNNRRQMAKALGVNPEGEVAPRGQAKTRTAGQIDAELRRLARENRDLWKQMSELETRVNQKLAKALGEEAPA